MKKYNKAALYAACTGALACSIGALYSVVTPNAPVNRTPVPMPSVITNVYNVDTLTASPSAVQIAIEESATPSPEPEPSIAPSPTKTVNDPKPEPTNPDWIEIKANPSDPTNAQGRYVGPSRSPGGR